jgi:hypothetical protein
MSGIFFRRESSRFVRIIEMIGKRHAMTSKIARMPQEAIVKLVIIIIVVLVEISGMRNASNNAAVTTIKNDRPNPLSSSRASGLDMLSSSKVISEREFLFDMVSPFILSSSKGFVAN